MHKPLTAIGAALSALQGIAADAPLGDATAIARVSMDADHTVVLALPLNAGVQNMYAGHRSHSSHASHSSHSSHYSGSGGSYSPATTPVAPTKSSPSPAPSAAPRSSTTAPMPLFSVPTTAKPSADQLQLMIMRVQAALYSKGYDPGAIDGVLSPATKNALRKYQAAQRLAVSGTMSTETLTALGISLAR